MANLSQTLLQHFMEKNEISEADKTSDESVKKKKYKNITIRGICRHEKGKMKSVNRKKSIEREISL